MPSGSSGEDPRGRATQTEARSTGRALLLKLLEENRFPSIWMPSLEQRDLRTLLLHRHQWVRMRTRVQNTLQAMALSNGLRRGTSLWSQEGQHALQSLPLWPHASSSSDRTAGLVPSIARSIDRSLDEQVKNKPCNVRRLPVNDPSRSRTDHRIGHGSVFG